MGVVVIVSGISQELLFHLCSRIVGSKFGPLLYGMCDFHFPRYLAYLSRPEVRTSNRRASLKGNAVSTSESTRSCTSRGAASESLSRSPAAEAVHKAERIAALSPSIFLSVDSLGVVSERADCVLLESNLARLARAFELVDPHFPEPTA